MPDKELTPETKALSLLEEPTFTCELNDEVDVTEHTIRLMCSNELGAWRPYGSEPPAEIWRWKRDDGVWVSPLFTSLEAAHYYADKVPFLSDEEWKQHNPVPPFSANQRKIN